ncbi:hypothetical protein CYMTET_34832, partial [Cymbomonas tetramitiformis]
DGVYLTPTWRSMTTDGVFDIHVALMSTDGTGAPHDPVGRSPGHLCPMTSVGPDYIRTNNRLPNSFSEYFSPNHVTYNRNAHNHPYNLNAHIRPSHNHTTHNYPSYN